MLKTPVLVSFFNNVGDLSLGTLLKGTQTQVFSCGICQFFKNTFFYRAPPVATSIKDECNKPKFKNDNYCIDKPMNFYLKWYFFEHSAS